ncbi:PIN domain nuclease [Mycobacterium sp.]|uniref:PIN domain nuclease n=1 Tax=Mycobacterium sp. TaxID=1785 RepID=UPI0012853DFC|nr:PIN domain nuclease [Mycobacterium sp.]KAA8963521.1 MAG: PIN domain nuclease [Mycobacterium sp.]
MTLFCVDTSAWHHAGRPEVAKRWLAVLSANQVGICDQVRLEILYSARSAADYDALADELDSLARIPIDTDTFARAYQVQRELAHAGGLHHRSVKIADLIIAAAAELSGTVLWHYDEDYDRVAGVTGQRTEWIVPRGSL